MRILLVAVLLAACTDDGVRHTPDATPRADAAIDGAPDAALAPAMLSGSPDATAFGDVVIGQVTAKVTYTISNDGDQPSGTLGVVLDSSTAGFAISDNQCSGVALAPHETCTFAVYFQPSAAGMAMTTVHAGASPGGDVARDLSGTGLQPGALDITEASHDFLSLAVDATQPAAHTFTVKNTGQAATGVPMPSIGGTPNTYAVASTTCTAMLAPQGTCTVTVRFAPATVGMKPGSLTVTATPGGSDAATLAGTGIAHVAVTKAGNGAGTVTSNVAGIGCGSACAADFSSTPVALTAAPATGSTFAGWMGDCSGTGTCTLDLTAHKNVTAAFTLEQLALTTGTTGNGSGTVTGAGTYDYGTMVTVTASPATGSTFTGWGGDCSGTGTCKVTMTAPHNVTAAFTLQQFALTTGTTGNGSGTISGAGTYDYGTMVTVTASPATGSTFTGWGGDCSGTGTCKVTMTAAHNVTASFTLQQFTLSTGTTGNGSGTITGAGTYNYGTQVTLGESPAVSSTFTGWGADCSGTGTCKVTMTAAHTVTADFTLKQFALTTGALGSGSGTITGGGTYSYGTPVQVTESAATGSSFGGWSGDCSGTGPCSVTMTAPHAVYATFNPIPETLTVTNGGNGTVTSLPAGITCGGQCASKFDYNTQVTLTPMPDPGYVFDTWGGDCTGSGTCTVKMDQAHNVSARFKAVQYTFDLKFLGDAPGTVTINGTPYTANTSFTVTYGQQLSLSEQPAVGGGFVFGGWSGACTGTASSCSITIAGDTTVGAEFDQGTYRYTLTAITKDTNYFYFDVKYPPNATSTQDCQSAASPGQNCAGSLARGTTVTLTAHLSPLFPTVWNDKPQWTGCDAVTADQLTCTFKLLSLRSITVTGDAAQQ